MRSSQISQSFSCITLDDGAFKNYAYSTNAFVLAKQNYVRLDAAASYSPLVFNAKTTQSDHHVRASIAMQNVAATIQDAVAIIIIKKASKADSRLGRRCRARM